MIKIRRLNENETYICSVKAVSDIFLDENLNVYFGYMAYSRLEDENNKKYRPNKKCKDRIVASFHICEKEIAGIKMGSFLVFYILNNIGVKEELKFKFENEVLKKLLSIYNDKIASHIECLITVGLNDDEFCFYTSEL